VSPTHLRSFRISGHSAIGNLQSAIALTRLNPKAHSDKLVPVSPSFVPLCLRGNMPGAVELKANHEGTKTPMLGSFGVSLSREEIDLSGDWRCQKLSDAAWTDSSGLCVFVVISAMAFSFEPTTKAQRHEAPSSMLKTRIEANFGGGKYNGNSPRQCALRWRSPQWVRPHRVGSPGPNPNQRKGRASGRAEPMQGAGAGNFGLNGAGSCEPSTSLTQLRGPFLFPATGLRSRL